MPTCRSRWWARFAFPTLRKHIYRRAAPQLCKQHEQVMMRERDAACRRRVAWARKMHEDGAAPPPHARAVVVTENENQIVEILAPAIVGPDGAQRKYRPRPRHTIGAIEHLTNGKPAERCRALAFPLQRLDAAPAERRAPHAMRQDKAAFPRISGCAPQRDVSLNSHGQLAFFLLAEANRPACPMGRPPLLLETSELTRGQPWAMRARSLSSTTMTSFAIP